MSCKPWLKITTNAWVVSTLIGCSSLSYADSCQNSINVTGVGIVVVKPDVVTLHYTVSANNSDPKLARADVEKSVTTFVESLKNQKQANNISFSAQDLILSPVYSYDDGKSILNGYKAIRNVEVKLTDFSLIDEINHLAINSGLNEISGFNYAVSNQDQYQQQALSLALDDAKAKATLIADKLNLKLSKACKVEYNHSLNAVPRLFMAKANMSDSNAVYKSEETQISAQVSVDFEIKK